MKYLIPFLFLSFAHASDSSVVKSSFKEGEYELVTKSSSTNCPDGNLLYIEKTEDGKKLNILLLADRISFELSSLGKEEIENVPESCNYKTKLSYEKEILIKTTVRSACPSKAENATIIEKLSHTQTGLFYEVINNDRSTLKCHYKPVTENEVKK